MLIKSLPYGYLEKKGPWVLGLDIRGGRNDRCAKRGKRIPSSVMRVVSSGVVVVGCRRRRRCHSYASHQPWNVQLSMLLSVCLSRSLKVGLSLSLCGNQRTPGVHLTPISNPPQEANLAPKMQNTPR